MQWDIHPKNKKPIGERLALLARGHVYDENIQCDAPEMISAEKSGSHLMIHFANAEGLHIQGDLLNALKVKKEGQYIDTVETEVQGDCLILHHMADAKEIYFAQDNYYEVNLYNGADIPAKPFRIMR